MDVLCNWCQLGWFYIEAFSFLGTLSSFPILSGDFYTYADR